MPSLFPTGLVETPKFDTGDWTAALPLCPLSRIATSTNQIYQNSGFKKDEHPFYETGFNFRQDYITYYGLFSGKGSARCAKFAASSFPAELILDSHITVNNSAEQIQHYLRDAWYSVDKSYMNSLDDLVAEQIRIQTASEDLGEQYQQYADVSRLSEIDREYKAIASGILALVIRDQVFLSYMGDCVGVLVHADENARESDPWDVSVLTCGHNLENEDEKLRLGPQALVNLQIADVRLTRFLGHPPLKKPSRELVPEPDELILNITDKWKFLVFASPGVFEALSHLNPELKDISKLAELLVRNIREELAHARKRDIGDKLNRVTQSVVDEIGRQHFEAYSESISEAVDFPSRRPDMTLLIRIFDESLIRYSGKSATSTRQSMRSTSSYGGESPTYRASPADRIPAVVDFSRFIENARADPNFPKELLEVESVEPLRGEEDELNASSEKSSC